MYIFDVIEKLQTMIDASKRIVFFGGAGVSTESGLPDFRSADGLYSQKYKYPPEIMLSRTFFDRHTKEFFDFYRDKLLLPDAKPNAAHHKLAELEAAGRLIAVITQNIDGLHQAAGSRNVLELHGSIHRNICMNCRKSYGISAMLESSGIPHCTCGGIIKPDVVLYEEGLDSEVLRQSIEMLSRADMLIIGGTSLVVYPAAGLINEFNGNHLVLINRDPGQFDERADLVIHRPIGEVLEQIVVQVI
ncbi:MAG: NAD-dependent protein deacylase [Clostridiaceae bacterium]|nr:NAD-dependent protein deacylase [Clostridiaceae bacterium]